MAPRSVEAAAPNNKQRALFVGDSAKADAAPELKESDALTTYTVRKMPRARSAKPISLFM